MDRPPSLRERKKQRTRLLIAETARRLFADRGFEVVSVAEIARAAEVSEATVFNYFPTKEDLVYQGMEAFEEALLQAIEERPPGEPAIEAFGRYVLEPRGFLAAKDEGSTRALLQVSRMIAASPALLTREHQILARYSDSLAELLADETGAGPSDVQPKVVAASLIGLHGALIGLVRSRIAEDSPDVRRLAREVRAEGERALDLLRQGLGGYAIKGLRQGLGGYAIKGPRRAIKGSREAIKGPREAGEGPHGAGRSSGKGPARSVGTAVRHGEADR